MESLFTNAGFYRVDDVQALDGFAPSYACRKAGLSNSFVCNVVELRSGTHGEYIYWHSNGRDIESYFAGHARSLARNG